MKKVMIDKTLSLTDQGIYDGDIQILSLVIDGVEVIHDHTDAGWAPSPDGPADGQTLDHSGSIDADPPKVTCRYTLKSADTAMDVPGTCPYDPEDPQAFLKELDKKAGIRPRSKDKPLVLSALRKVFRYLTQRPVTPGDPIPIKHTHISDRSGWHHINKQWLCLTSEFAITKNGIDYNWHCTAPNAYLKYDPDMAAADAYLRALDLLKLDYRFAAPIFTSTVLSFLYPLRDMMVDKSIPGLLISGPTGCGKSKLAICQTHILTDREGRLEEMFLIHELEKKLKKAICGLADTTIILDDIRRSPSSATKQRIYSTLDTFVRDCYSSGHLLPVITAESDALTNMLPSLMNRCINIVLDRSSDHIKDLQDLLRRFYEDSMIVRTFFRHFIQFLAGYFEEKGNKYHFQDVEKRFDAILPDLGSHSRERDNLLFSYWAFDIFIRYGKDLRVLDPDQAKDLTDRYGDILRELARLQDLRDPETQSSSLLSLIAEKMRIQTAVCIERSGNDFRHDLANQPYFGTYGYHAVIDRDDHFSGVLIKDATLLYGYPKYHPSSTLLVLEQKETERLFLTIRKDFLKMGYEFLYRSFHQFLKELRKKHILLTEPRHEKDPQSANLLIDKYPFYENRKVVDGKVYVFLLEDGLKDTIEAACIPELVAHQISINSKFVEQCAARLKCLI